MRPRIHVGLNEGISSRRPPFRRGLIGVIQVFGPSIAPLHNVAVEQAQDG
jgi:hypothetical protein